MIQRNRSENWKTDWKLPKLNRKKEKKKDLKLEDSLRDLLNNIKCTSFPLLGSQKKREKRGQRTRLKK